VPNYKGSGFDFQVQSGGSTLIGSFPTGCAICSYTDFATTGNNASATINLRSAQVTPANRWASVLGVLFLIVNQLVAGPPSALPGPNGWPAVLEYRVRAPACSAKLLRRAKHWLAAVAVVTGSEDGACLPATRVSCDAGRQQKAQAPCL